MTLPDLSHPDMAYAASCSAMTRLDDVSISHLDTQGVHAMTPRSHTIGKSAATAIVGAAIVGVALTGCSSSAGEVTAVSAPSTSYVDNPVDPAQLNQVLDRIAATGLPVTGRHDATAARCPEAGCSSAVASDPVVLLQFPTSGRAQLYAGAHPGDFQVVDIVMTFPEGTDAAQNARYKDALQGEMR